MKRARRWLVPALCVVFAAAYAAVFLAVHKPVAAVLGAAVMLGYGLILMIFSRRSETIALLREDARDERRSLIIMKASASALYVVLVLAVIMAFVEFAHGDDPGAWGIICAVGGIAFIVSVAYYSRRS